MENEVTDLSSKEFGLEKKGYNKEEVKNYISELSNNLEKYVEQIRALEEENESLRSKVEEYQQIDKEIRNTLVFLKETERDSVIKTKDEISEMLRTAENKKEEILFDAEKEAKTTRDTLLFMKEQHEIMITRLKIIVDNQEGMLKDFKRDSNSAQLQKTMAEAAASKAQAELNIDSILEKLL